MAVPTISLARDYYREITNEGITTEKSEYSDPQEKEPPVPKEHARADEILFQLGHATFFREKLIPAWRRFLQFDLGRLRTIPCPRAGNIFT